MKVVVILERRFEQTADGAVWTRGDAAHAFWARYLSVFEGVKLVARTRLVGRVPAGASRVDGVGVEVISLPHYVGPWGYLRHWSRIRRILAGAIAATDAVILRVPSQLATTAAPMLRTQKRPYGVEVLGDPYEVFAPRAVRHPLSRFFRWWFPRNMRRQCAAACAVAYVTKETLQKRYPSGDHSIAVSDVEVTAQDFVAAERVLSTHYSSVELPPSAFASSARARGDQAGPWVLVSVGSLEQPYKGADVLIDAIELCVRRGVDLELLLIGDGRFRGQLEGRVTSLGLDGRVRFLGQVPGANAVRQHLDRADLFVLASRTEGLPRAMVEAMARALPCIGTRVGGVPELLEEEDLVPPGDAPRLAAKIEEVLGSQNRLERMSKRNLARAAEYRDDLLAPRRNDFYRHVRESLQFWLSTSRRRQTVGSSN